MRLRSWGAIGLSLMLVTAPTMGGAIGARLVSTPSEMTGDGLEVPEAWAGIWLYQSTTKNCTTGAVISMSSYSDTLCAGEILLPGGGFYDTCTGAYTETTFTSDCTASRDFLPQCQASYRLVQNGTRNGTSVQLTARSTTTFSGSGCTGLVDQCFDFVTTGTRVASAPVPCGVPVEAVHWSGIKARYR